MNTDTVSQTAVDQAADEIARLLCAVLGRDAAEFAAASPALAEGSTGHWSVIRSDGMVPCPVPAPHTGDPCTKRIPSGWTVDQGHGGGHFWMPAAIRERLDRGDHYDSTAAISGQPFTFHTAEDCAPGCWQFPDTAGKETT